MSDVGANLGKLLRRAARVKRTTRTLCAAGFAVAVLAAALLGVVMLDAATGLSTAGLLALDAGLVMLGCAAIGYVISPSLRRGGDPRSLARMLERSLGIGDSRLINAVDLAAAATPGCSESLRRMAIDAGDRAAEGLDAAAVADRHGLHRTMLAAGAAVIVLAGSYAGLPRIFGAVVPRLLHPTAQLPPFTLLSFDVRIEPTVVHANHPATIRAKITGPFVLPDAAEVVFAEGEKNRGLPMLSGGTGEFALTLDHATGPQRFYIATTQGRSAWYTLDVSAVPLLEKVRVRYDYPAYTHWKPVEQPLDSRGIRAIEGTTITLTVESNVQLASVGLYADPPSSTGNRPTAIRAQVPHEVVAPADKRPVIQTHARPIEGYPKRLSLRFPVETGTFRLIATSYREVPSDPSPLVRITAMADAAPQVELMQPDLRVVAPEGFTVPVAAEASDDVAVGRMVLRRELDGRSLPDVMLTPEYHGPAQARATSGVNLAEIGAHAGQTVRGFVTAFDNHPDPVHSADSATFEVRVVSEQQYEQMAREQTTADQIAAEAGAFREQMKQLDAQRQQLIRQLEQLQKQMQKPSAGAAQRKQMEDAQRQLGEYARQAKQLADRMQQRAEQAPLYEFEKPYEQELRKLAESLHNQSKTAAGDRQRLEKQPDEKSVEQALEHLRGQQQRAGQDSQTAGAMSKDLDRIALADRMMNAVDRLTSIAKHQQDLADRLAPYQHATPTDPAEIQRLHELGEQQAQLREALEQTLTQLEHDAKQADQSLPKMSDSAKQIVKKIREMKVEQDQQNSTQNAAKNNGPDAQKLAQSAADKLNSMVHECSACRNSGDGDLDGALGMTKPGLSKSLGQLAEARAARAAHGMSGNGSGTTGKSGPGGSAASSGSQPGAGGEARLMGPLSRNASTQVGDQKHHARSFSKLSDTPGLDNGSGPERMHVDTHEHGEGAGGDAGVPLEYRELAEEYFRRLAKDSR